MPIWTLILMIMAVGLLSWLLYRARALQRSFQADWIRLEERYRALEERSMDLDQSLENQRRECKSLQHENLALEKSLSELSALYESEKSQSLKQSQQWQLARTELSKEFQLLAAQILEEKSQGFARVQGEQLGQILDPLKQKLGEFQQQVAEAYRLEGQERFALAEQVKQLLQMNEKLGQEAQSLSRALRGDTKLQGNWGEMILESVLESSGLRRGMEYEVQSSHEREGSRFQPDVVLHLPENRHLIIDSKVSLVAFDEYRQAENPAAQSLALKKHLDSMRSHIRGLASKQYEKLHGEHSPDFVLMFVPLEPAFMLGMSEGGNLWQEAWDKNVLLVSPSTLLFVLRTIAQLWRQENQNKNAQEIARRGAELYDKFCGFLQDYKEVGQRLRMASESYEGGLRKLSEGRGNLLRQAEMLRELGVKPSKQMPSLDGRAEIES